MFMKAWPVWSGLLVAIVVGMMWKAGWIDLVAGIVVVLTVAPILYVLVVILFFNDWRRS